MKYFITLLIIFVYLFSSISQIEGEDQTKSLPGVSVTGKTGPITDPRTGIVLGFDYLSNGNILGYFSRSGW